MKNKYDKIKYKLFTIIGFIIILAIFTSISFLHYSLTVAVKNTAFTLVVKLLVVLTIKLTDRNANELQKDRERLAPQAGEATKKASVWRVV